MAVYQSNRVIPYIHAMVNHVGEIMRTHGSIIPLMQRDIMTKTYFCRYSHRGIRALSHVKAPYFVASLCLRNMNVYTKTKVLFKFEIECERTR